ncbi:Bacteriophage protein GP30.3 [Nannocystis exedens]|uniref:Bacteriophage protein GP30.3 n=1 Tax=Nannocystis exedens TaxID=54 RepID=A0A1I2D7B7_9BACT|nr:hypothetical protein [Nannocystis exedens]PCC70716.1 hypothetical protein NAEX_03780 [Nannocystis exedens]SFE75860.1 Bacteriophage protein GP30.3 [Nannocystis exedens]
MASARPLRELLKGRGVAEACRSIDPGDPQLEGLLYEGRRATVGDARAAEHEARTLKLGPGEYAAWRAQQRRPLQHMISGAPLASDSPAPFVLGGLECRSVWSFYQCLKLPEDDPARAAVAAGTSGRRRVGTGGRRTFRWRGEEIAVGSPEHGALIARATEAKLRAHPDVCQALLATGMSLLYMGPADAQALGRYMPLALMVLRFRLQGK